MEKNNNLFKTFAKGQMTVQTISNEIVVYTRVSSAKQMDGLSLEVQLKGCTDYADKYKLQIREIFGGTYESAAKDERKEFQRMITYLKKTRYKISKILVYSLERFSRNENSIWLSSQLRKLGIEVVSVTQPIDTSNPAGIMQQKMLFLFGEFDNQLRRKKCMDGVKAHLLQGEWCMRPPVGYDVVKHNRDRKIVVNETGLIIKKMFHWKAKERMPNVEIQQRLKPYKLDYGLRRINEILTNPFYCGKLVHKALEGEVKDGRHEKLVSEAVFLEANNIIAAKKLGLQTKKERRELALKRFIRCSTCNRPLRGYIAQDYDMPYYKCNTKGCKCSKNGNLLNKQFETLLSSYQINETYMPLIKEQLILTFQEHNKGLQENKEAITKQIAAIKPQLERLEERFILEEITADLYQKYKARFEKQIEELAQQMTENEIEWSRLDEYITFSLSNCTNLSKMWASGDYTQRQELQYALFNEGIVYDRQKDRCLDTSDNEFLNAIARISTDSGYLINNNSYILPQASARSFRAESGKAKLH